MERARRLLAHEAAASNADDQATTAAGRVYEKLHVNMDPLVGAPGVHLLFLRSARILQGEFAGFAEVSILEGSAKLRERMRAQAPPVATESAAALFGTFFTLSAAFIGERLTTQVLRTTWPTFEEPEPLENHK